jgi:hypothetical protein
MAEGLPINCPGQTSVVPEAAIEKKVMVYRKNSLIIIYSTEKPLRRRGHGYSPVIFTTWAIVDHLTLKPTCGFDRLCHHKSFDWLFLNN